MQDQELLDDGQAEVERVRRHVMAVHERIRAINQTLNESEETTQPYI